MTHLRMGRERRVSRRVGLAARRVVVTVAGVAVILVGAVLLFTPGPGLGAIAAGLALLATEYDWARRAYRQVKQRSKAAYDGARSRLNGRRGPN